jgi:hypothetical protein
VELVGGSIGDPGQGRMCLMSLVAFLAGEPHSDAPGCASPLVQAFAVAANDLMPRAARQRLKPFAPRIIGTDDGFDGVRAEVLRQALAGEIPPEAPGGRRPAGRDAPAKGGFAKLRRLWRWLRKDERGRLLDRALSRGEGVHLARKAARLVARSARRAPDARERERHWDAAIGLLDRLCDVGAPAQRRGGLGGVRTERLARLEPRRDAPGREEERPALRPLR